MSAIELDFNHKMARLLQYHRSIERLVSAPRFTDFSREDRPTVERNFHRTLRHTEKLRDQKLKELLTKCDQDQEAWLGARLQSALEHARGLLANSSAHFRELIGKMEGYKLRLQYHLWHCDRERKMVQFLFCYSEELVTLIQWVDHFIDQLWLVFKEVNDPATPTTTTAATVKDRTVAPVTTEAPSQHPTTQYYGDDEDLVTSFSGSGELGGARPTGSHAPSSPATSSGSAPTQGTTPTEGTTPTQQPEVSMQVETTEGQVPSTLSEETGEDP